MAETARKREVLFYQDINGNEPFVDWLESLRNGQARRRILKRLRMVEQGHLGDYLCFERITLKMLSVCKEITSFKTEILLLRKCFQRMVSY